MASRKLLMKTKHNCRQLGLSMLELMAGLAILLIVSGSIMGAMIGMMKNQAQVANRTEMHSSVRSATELIEQEITQAGRIVLPGTTPVTLTAATIANASQATVSSTAGMFVNEQLTFDSGPSQDTGQILSMTGNTITFQNGSFLYHAHNAGAAVIPMGGFSSGVVPPSVTGGSDGTHLKIFGDINGDGNMVYIEYTCDWQTNHKLYRNVLLVSATNKPATNDSMSLLDNVYQNPNDLNGNAVPCFNYQVASNINGNDYVLDVAVTLTVQTQHADAWNGSTASQSTKETKALLNVAPRNVFETWEQASAGITNRVQPIPANVTCLLSATPTSNCIQP